MYSKSRGKEKRYHEGVRVRREGDARDVRDGHAAAHRSVELLHLRDIREESRRKKKMRSEAKINRM
jgi:hypothetical protein